MSQLKFSHWVAAAALAAVSGLAAAHPRAVVVAPPVGLTAPLVIAPAVPGYPTYQPVYGGYPGYAGYPVRHGYPVHRIVAPAVVIRPPVVTVVGWPSHHRWHHGAACGHRHHHAVRAW